jgi:hypothetical protein
VLADHDAELDPSRVLEPFGIMVSSFGPQMRGGRALLKMIGSFGIFIPASAAGRSS